MGSRRESQLLETTGEVSAALGGPARVSELTGASYKRCWDWTKDDTFPSHYYVVMTFELKKRRLKAPPSLWGMVTTPEIEQAVA